MIMGNGYTLTDRKGVKEIRFGPGLPIGPASVLEVLLNHGTKFPVWVIVWSGDTEKSWEQWISPQQPIYCTSRAELAAVYRSQLGKSLPWDREG